MAGEKFAFEVEPQEGTHFRGIIRVRLPSGEAVQYVVDVPDFKGVRVEAEQAHVHVDAYVRPV